MPLPHRRLFARCCRCPPLGQVQAAQNWVQGCDGDVVHARVCVCSGGEGEGSAGGSHPLLPWLCVMYARMAIAAFGASDAALACGLFRLLRLRRAVSLMGSMEKNIDLNYHTAVIFRLLSVLLLMAHWEACGFWYLAYANNFDETTWAFHFGEYRPGQTTWDHYLSAVYWTFTTLSTTGYGDLVPVNDTERVYTVCMMVLNIGLTAYIVGNMTVLVTKDDSSSLEYRGIMSHLKAYMKHKGISDDLKAMALQHLKLKREMQVERDDVLDHCAPYIRSRILASLYKGKLSSCGLFQGTSESFIDAISQAAYMEFVFPDSWLLNAGERSTHLYYIMSGSLEVLNKDGVQLWAIGEGATIGDETALCDFPAAYSYLSRTLVKALVIPVAALRQACTQNKLSHRLACYNLQSCLRGIDPVLEPEVSERIRQVASYVTARRTDMVTKLCYAASTNDLPYMKQLLNSDPEHDINFGDYDGRRPLHIAAAYGRLPILKHLVCNIDADVNTKDAMGCSPLHDAVKHGHRAAAEFLRSNGAELNLEDPGSALCNAVFRGQADLLQLYLDFGANPNEGDYDRRTPMHIACAEGMLTIVKILVASGADLHARDRWQETPVHEAKKSPNQLTVAAYLAEVLEQQSNKSLAETSQFGE
mmetsp:Transcript_22528/g.58745  ORF Transcript_22528/g.58745 Transcript_22528/m.58745 type:complete len:645 (-) Transcript_22528:387-2321(-)